MKHRLIRALSVAALLTASLAAPAMADLITGTSGPDVLIGTAKADTIRGYAGDDVLRGKLGTDHLYGGVGADRLYAGKDLKPDVLYGRRGPDRLHATVPDDVYAGRGNDVIIIHPNEGEDMDHVDVICGPGYDRIVDLNGGALLGVKGCEDLPWD